MRYFVQIGGETHAFDVLRTPEGDYRASSADGREFVFHPLGQHGPLHTFSVAGQVLEVQSSEGEVILDGQRHRATVESERERARDAAIDRGARRGTLPELGAQLRGQGARSVAG